MQSRHAGYFYPLPCLPLSYLSHNWQKPEVNQLPHQSLCRLTSTIQHYNREEKKTRMLKPNWLLETIRNSFSQEQLQYVFLSWSHYYKKRNSYRWGKRRNARQKGIFPLRAKLNQITSVKIFQQAILCNNI